ncbi:MAG: Uma2 family endonuclease [Chloroflexi bacterium]|nr:Uma2 family endonuclease [Chloroflexota bacterium]
MAVSIPRRLFTVDEYYRMAAAGVFKPGERVELLDGEIIPMNPIGSEHAWCVNRVSGIFFRFADYLKVGTQNPLRLSDRSEPQPDLLILQPDTPEDRHPEPADVFLAIEVAESSPRVDRGRKRSLYARAGIPEYWILDLNAQRIEAYRDPVRSRYRTAALFGRGDTISPLFAPDLVIDVATILGKPPAAQSPPQS